MLGTDNLLLLCEAALQVEEEDAAESRKRYEYQKIMSEIGLKQAREIEKSISIKQLSALDLYENTSDELNRKFSYRCIYSPTECTFVAKSYGSETKSFSLIQDHIYEHIKNETNQKYGIHPKRSDKLPYPVLKSLETSLLKGSDDGHLFSQELAEGMGWYVPVPWFEHDYAKSGNEPPARNSESEWKKRKRVNATHDKSGLQYLDRCLRGQSYAMPSCVPTGPFPFVHHPDSLEPAAVEEFYSNGEPVHGYRWEIDGVALKKKLQSLANKRKPKPKFSRAVDEVRSVLECVENRVACKPSALCDEQKDSLVPHKGIENSENMEEVAKRNILILTQQRKKRRSRDKPSVYICEICNKHFTANTSLTYHYLGHLNIKPFDCKVCSRTFTRRHSLKYHMMIHNGKNRFECSVCNKQFRHPSHYKEHLRKHTGEEPFSCKFCSNNFKTRNSYKRHLRMQHQKLLTSNDIVPISEDN